MEELKKCPFCGGEAKVDELKLSNEFSYKRVFCTKCKARTKNYRSYDEAIGAWNDRH